MSTLLHCALSAVIGLMAWASILYLRSIAPKKNTYIYGHLVDSIDLGETEWQSRTLLSLAGSATSVVLFTIHGPTKHLVTLELKGDRFVASYDPRDLDEAAAAFIDVLVGVLNRSGRH